MNNNVPFVGDEYLARVSDKRVFSDHSAFADDTVKDNKAYTRLDWHPINNGHGIKVHVVGDIDINALDQWRKLIKETNGNGINQFEFDLKDVRSMSLAGLAILLLFKDNKQAQARDICLTQCSNDLYKRLVWSGLTKEFIVRPSRKL